MPVRSAAWSGHNTSSTPKTKMKLHNYTVSFLVALLFAFQFSVGAQAQDPDCAFACYHDSFDTETGEIPDCAAVLIIIYNPVNGTEDAVWPSGAGPNCVDCTPCQWSVGAFWDLTGCSGTDYAVSYNSCAQLTGVGSSRSTIKADCGAFEVLTVKFGIRNPNFDPMNCPPSTPLILGAAWLKDFLFICESACGPG